MNNRGAGSQMCCFNTTISSQEGLFYLLDVCNNRKSWLCMCWYRRTVSCYINTIQVSIGKFDTASLLLYLIQLLSTPIFVYIHYTIAEREANFTCYNRFLLKTCYTAVYITKSSFPRCWFQSTGPLSSKVKITEPFNQNCGH